MRKIVCLICFVFFISLNSIPCKGEERVSVYGDMFIQSGKLYKIMNLSNGMYLGVKKEEFKDKDGISITEDDNAAIPWQVNVEGIDDNGNIIASFAIHDKGLFLGALDESKNAKRGEYAYILQNYRGSHNELFKLERIAHSNRYSIKGIQGESMNLQMFGIDNWDSQEAYWKFEEVEGKKSHREIIGYWAPDVYQDFNTVNDEFHNYDYITNFNFDGDWNGFNNWENAASKEHREKGKDAYVYASIQETPTHYFIQYDFFHPRDVGGTHFAIYAIDSHENDLEGALFAVKKDGTPYGKVELIYTQAHGKHDTYKENKIRFRNDDKTTGKVEIFSSSNGTAVGTHGHSVHMWKEQYDGGIKYINKYTEGIGDIGESERANFNVDEDDVYKECSYKILSLDEIWTRRYHIGNGKTFRSFGGFGADESGFKDHLGMTMKGGANAPWNWDKGLWMSDPALFMDKNDYFKELNHNYTFNKYVTHRIGVEKIKANVYKDPLINSDRKTDLFIRVQVAGVKYIDLEDFKKSNVDNHVWQDFYFGGIDDSPLEYTEKINHIFVARDKNSDIIFELRDHDTGYDDTLGEIKFNLEPGEELQFEEDTNGREGSIKASIYTR